MIIYFLSGLGADYRAFSRITLPPEYTMVHLAWEPVFGNESIEEYAQIMLRKIDSSKPFMLAGLSFGGIMATEICKFIKPEKLILLSTIKTRDDLPLLYRLAGKLKLYKFIPSIFFRASIPFLYWFFGPLDREGKLLVAAFLKQTGAAYLRWALGRISNWQNIQEFEPSLHIQGKKDKALPVGLTKPDYVINGGHFCVLTHAEEVNELLRKEL